MHRQPSAHDHLERSGDVLGGRYRLDAILGRGGQGAVYSATDLRDGDRVAVKVLPREASPDAIERMFREAFIMSTLQGTAAVRVLHQVRTDGGAAIVMELLHGEDLEDLMRRYTAHDVPMPIDLVVRLLSPIVATLEAAHERGIVHRDVKPGNVFVLDSTTGDVRLLDFGFAKLASAIGITKPEELAGTPSYIAPELWMGGARAADPRCDVYSLAVLVFRLLGGRHPFEGTLLEIMREATSAMRPSLHALRSELPPSVDEWAGQALAIRPDDRFARIGAMWAALLSCLR
jgi:serine/threonine-protein kinase